MKTVYAVVRDEYDSHEVACLFEDEADADRHAAVVNAAIGVEYRGFYVEPFTLVPPGGRPGRYIYWYGHARGLSDPRVYCQESWEYGHPTNSPPPAVPVVTVEDADFPNRALANVLGADEDSVTAALHAKLRELRGPDYRPPGLFRPALPEPSCYSHPAGFMVHAKSVCRCKDAAR